MNGLFLRDLMMEGILRAQSEEFWQGVFLTLISGLITVVMCLILRRRK